jgi:hypothetical protein
MTFSRNLFPTKIAFTGISFGPGSQEERNLSLFITGSLAYDFLEANRGNLFCVIWHHSHDTYMTLTPDPQYSDDR